MNKRKNTLELGCTEENWDCNLCVYYGGKGHGTIRCLADECSSKKTNKAARRERMNNGSQNKSRNP